jgi:hypothetical protein
MLLLSSVVSSVPDQDPKPDLDPPDPQSTCFWASRIRIQIHQSETWIRGSGSTPKCHGSPNSAIKRKNVTPFSMMSHSPSAGGTVMNTERTFQDILVHFPDDLDPISDASQQAFRIRDNLVLIRILESVTLTNGSGCGSGSAPKSSATFRKQKTLYFSYFLCFKK